MNVLHDLFEHPFALAICTVVLIIILIYIIVYAWDFVTTNKNDKK